MDMTGFLFDHLEEAAIVCQIIAVVLLCRGWWLGREARKLRKSQDYWRDPP